MISSIHSNLTRSVNSRSLPQKVVLVRAINKSIFTECYFKVADKRSLDWTWMDLEWTISLHFVLDFDVKLVSLARNRLRNGLFKIQNGKFVASCDLQRKALKGIQRVRIYSKKIQIGKFGEWKSVKTGISVKDRYLL